MAITLRTRPTCHYCGKRNGPSNNQDKFTCQHCEAENYLDESGQLRDVPASAAAPQQRFAVPIAPTFDSPEGSIFCSTCLKNQYMYNTALSEYLPDPDHPEYEKLEAGIPVFKQSLERRFPTCCANCEPKVKAQLQQATYNARSDHLRRVLDRSRQRRNANRWGWRSLLVNAAGLGWIVSLATQLIWHAVGSQAHRNTMISDIGPAQCLVTWPVPAQCPSIFEQFVGPSLLLGGVCIWWNPKWQHKLEGREGRLLGLDEFYKVQVMLLGLRFMSWTAIKDIPYLVEFRSVIHTIAMVLIMIVAGWSRFKIVSVYVPQIVDWSQNPAPLLDHKQYVPPPPSQESLPFGSRQPVPLSIFSTSAANGPQAWRPPTPPVDDDVMEWDPTPAAFDPNLKKINYKSKEPTPFRGTLPAFPRGGMYSTKETSVEQPKAIGLPLGFFDKSHGQRLESKGLPRRDDNGLVQPKFFPDVGKADTGLEGIFDTVFSLKDETNLPSTSSLPFKTNTSDASSTRDMGQSTNTTISLKQALQMRQVYHISSVMLTAILATSFLVQTYFGLSLVLTIPIYSIIYILSIIPALDIIVETAVCYAAKSARASSWKLVVLLLESVGLFFLKDTQPDSQSSLLPLWNKSVIASILVLMAQEVHSYCVNVDMLPVHPDSYTDSISVNKEDESMPEAVPTPQYQPSMAESLSLHRMPSDESLASTASIATTSTASGWKTPVVNHREELSKLTGSVPYGLGGLSLKNDYAFGSGNSVAGSRNRRTPAQGGQRGW